MQETAASFAAKQRLCIMKNPSSASAHTYAVRIWGALVALTLDGLICRVAERRDGSCFLVGIGIGADILASSLFWTSSLQCLSQHSAYASATAKSFESTRFPSMLATKKQLTTPDTGFASSD
jgi:hypothetical protein